jgi:hypothetical protein
VISTGAENEKSNRSLSGNRLERWSQWTVWFRWSV